MLWSVSSMLFLRTSKVGGGHVSPLWFLFDCVVVAVLEGFMVLSSFAYILMSHCLL